MKKFILIILIIIGVLFMLNQVNAMIKNSIGDIVYRGNVVTGVVAKDNGNKSYDCYIMESNVAYPGIFTLSANPNLAVGDTVRILYRNGNKELPIILPPTAATGTPSLQESFVPTSTPLFAHAYGEVWRVQTFLTTSAHTINYVELLIKKRLVTSVPGTVTIEIRKADGDDKPTGAVLTSGTINGNTLPLVAEWKKIDLTKYDLENNTKYAIIWRASDAADQYHSAGLMAQYYGYSDGKLGNSSDAGSTWTTSVSDAGFKIYGY